MTGRLTRGLGVALLLTVLLVAGPGGAREHVEIVGGSGRPITLVVRDAPVTEVFEMLARYEKVSIVLPTGIEGHVTVNLFEQSLDRTIRAVAEAAGYRAERRDEGYTIVAKGDVGKDAARGSTIIRTLRVHYSDAKIVADILKKYLSRYGEVTVLEERGMIVVEDLPDFVARIEDLMAELDGHPKQILIEARILEISLDDSDFYGIDWIKTFEAFDGVGDVIVSGLANPAQPGLMFDIVTPDVAVILTALQEEGRVRTLSTPTLLTLENEKAEVVIGDRLGFRVVTTVNDVTSESVEFLESGVILKIEASVHRSGSVMLSVHPEVSTGVIEDGLPSQTTTEVTTKLIAEDGQPVFIGGLIKDRSTQGRRGVPFLMDIPVLGWLFTRREDFALRTETVVLLMANVQEEGRRERARDKTRWLPDVQKDFDRNRRRLERAFDAEPGPPAPTQPVSTSPPGTAGGSAPAATDARAEGETQPPGAAAAPD